VRQPAAKVKKEPDTELLISPALKEKILNKEGVDLKRIDHEYQEKKGNGKGNGKEKQETKIISQEPGKDSCINDEKIIDVDLSEHFNREWNKVKWYSVSAIASKLGIHRNTVAYWRDFGIKINGVTIRLKMAKKPNLWYAKGKWLIEFFLKINVEVDMDGT
jgi:ribosomal protein S25